MCRRWAWLSSLRVIGTWPVTLILSIDAYRLISRLLITSITHFATPSALPNINKNIRIKVVPITIRTITIILIIASIGLNVICLRMIITVLVYILFLAHMVETFIGIMRLTKLLWKVLGWIMHSWSSKLVIVWSRIRHLFYVKFILLILLRQTMNEWMIY